jgi:Glycosyltransferase family 87
MSAACARLRLPHPHATPSRVARLAFLGVVGLLTVLLLTRIGQAFTRWDGVDLDVYRRAGHEWLAHGNPYHFEGTAGVASYRYAPWFAVLWIPLSLLPRDLIEVAWSITLLLASGAVVVSLVRENGESGLPLALLGAALLVSTIAGGNVQPLIVAAVYFSLHRPSGPIWVGIAASLKIVPILYIIPWIARREWSKAAAAVFVMALLLTPAGLLTLPADISRPGAGEYPWLVLWLVVATLGVVAAVVTARTRLGWLGAGTAAVLMLPRLLSVDLTLILPAAKQARASAKPARSHVLFDALSSVSHEH